MEYKNLRQYKKGHIRIVYISHPPVNSWDLATVEEFEKIMNELENDKETRVIIITGAIDNCFSAGFDIKDTENAIIIGKIARGLWKRIDRYPKPIIAAINGFALGGGLELAMACHFRIMADDTKVTVGLTELNLGIIPAWGGTQLLPRLVGRAKALDMILFSRRIDAQEALSIGLVNALSKPDKLMADALDFAEKLAERPPIALGWVLKAMAAGAYDGLEEGWRIEAEGSARVRETGDRMEGFNALLEKRKPVFKGE